ncbi:glycolate oxidase subunit GlcE [Rhodocyclus tenuis]|uniref:glycolate oxidase subunit GlcE n=1 Tax=Rhodocyclus tenuis TaxID=1066 RepID=UPI0019062212|nr:glycolate oxidase subunit GlcE [Rhodocyclus tenuis]MBK1681071.1 glycolate oxidase subunit GlcE [Rhodocyclus tenuis]
MDAILKRWSERVRAAHADSRPLSLQGSGSKAFYGQPTAAGGEPFDTREYRGVVAYAPSELVVTARCGTPLAELEAELAAHGQMLACEPPHFGPGATVGGMLAAGLSGPRRMQAGAVRDFVLGVRLIDGEGRLLAFGGQVMKNVAGYDVSRLLAGSLGTLALVAEVSLKTLPLPFAERSLQFEMPQRDALASLAAWNSQPLPISAAAWADGCLWLRLSGAAAALTAATDRLCREAAAAGFPARVADAILAKAFWRSLREQTHHFFTDQHSASGQAQPLWRLAMPPTTPALADGGYGLSDETLIEWGGALRWLRGGDPDAIRTAAADAGGHATLFRADAALRSAVGVFSPLPPALAAIHRRVRNAFDPHGVFNPGRLYPDM